ncbi:MAG: hypothetical protein E7017_07190 [Alphaproteobacteria bacterium]|nr:hypothetical protein [Alphaproteobacteria bacterium]
MKLHITSLLFFIIISTPVFAQNNSLPQDFLFDDSDIIITAPSTSSNDTKKIEYSDSDKIEAISQARKLLDQKPTKLKGFSSSQTQKTIHSKKTISSNSSSDVHALKEAPFGLIWRSTMADTQNQGVILASVDMKDYANSFLATRLPKPISFFDRIYVVFGKNDELYRILAYSQFIDDDASASKTLKQYNTFSDLLNKKYGNKQEFFTPATISKTIKNSRGQNETVEEKLPIGNPEFLSQLESGSASLFSTYHNDNVAAALSIGVDGNKKSYIVIDYKNIQILKEQEAQTLDAL